MSLRREHWTSVEAELTGTRLRSWLVPANEALSIVVGPGTPFGRYLDTGVGSDTLKSPLFTAPRLPNLWFTAIGQSLEATEFEAFRSATIVHYGEPDATFRERVTEYHLRELLEAVAYRQLMQRDERKMQMLVLNEDALEVDLTSIDLQSYSATGDDAIEQGTIDEARRAFRTFENEGVRIATRWGFLQVVFRFHLLNLPSHPNAYRYGTGWDRLDETLSEVQELLGRATAKMPELSEASRRKVQRLTTEIEKIVATKRYREATNIYGLGARILNLAFLLGDAVHMNCRSGKDRTGMLDVEAKFVAYQQERIELGREVSEYHQWPLACERPAWRILLFKSGNIVIQKLNSGYAGSKLTAVSDDLETDPFVLRVGYDDWPAFVAEGARAQV